MEKEYFSACILYLYTQVSERERIFIQSKVILNESVIRQSRAFYLTQCVPIFSLSLEIILEKNRRKNICSILLTCVIENDVLREKLRHSGIPLNKK